MNIVIDVPPDPVHWRVAFRHVLKGPTRRLRVFGTVFVVLGLLGLLIGGDAVIRVAISAMFITIGLIYALLTPALSVARSLKRMPMVLTQPQRIELTDRSVRVGSPLVTTEYAWAAFQRAEVIPGYLPLMVGRYQVMPVPLAGLDPQELAQITEFAANLNYVRQ